MGVLAPGSGNASPSARPPINLSGNFPAHIFRTLTDLLLIFSKKHFKTCNILEPCDNPFNSMWPGNVSNDPRLRKKYDKIKVSKALWNPSQDRARSTQSFKKITSCTYKGQLSVPGAPINCINRILMFVWSLLNKKKFQSFQFTAREMKTLDKGF